MKVCQCCGKKITAKQEYIKISYMGAKNLAKPHPVKLVDADYFHKKCDVAIRSGKQ